MHLRGAKGMMYEGGIRVPMIVRWTGRIPANTTSDQPWYFADVMPTLAELTGAGEHVPRHRRHLDAARHPGRRRRRAEAGKPPVHVLGVGQRTPVAAGGPHGPLEGGPTGGRQAVELYDLQTDESETTDVARDPPEILAKIQAYLETCRTAPRPQEEPDGTGDWRFR
jgi:arylsulfatase A